MVAVATGFARPDARERAQTRRCAADVRWASMNRCPSGERTPNSFIPHASSTRSLTISALTAVTGVIGVDVVDFEIRDVTVIANVARARSVRAVAQHELDGTRSAEHPVARVRIVGLAPDDVVIPARQAGRSLHGEYRVGCEDLHGGQPVLERRRPRRAFRAISLYAGHWNVLAHSCRGAARPEHGTQDWLGRNWFGRCAEGVIRRGGHRPASREDQEDGSRTPGSFWVSRLKRGKDEDGVETKRSREVLARRAVLNPRRQCPAA